MNIKIFGIAALALAASGSINAAELLLTSGVAKKASVTSMAIDVVSSGDVRGFDFVIPVEKGVKVDTSKCFANLPKGFQGSCTFNGEEVVGLAFSWEKILLPEGVHSIGTVTFSGRVSPKALNVQFNAADTNAKKIASSVIAE